MAKKRNIFFIITLLIIACFCMSACTPSTEDEQKDPVNSEQSVDDETNIQDTDEDSYAMPEGDYLEDDEIGPDGESEEAYEEATEEEIIIPEEDSTEEAEEEIIWEEE